MSKREKASRNSGLESVTRPQVDRFTNPRSALYVLAVSVGRRRTC